MSAFYKSALCITPPLSSRNPHLHHGLLGDLYKLCTSSNEGDKNACRFYIFGVFEGAQLVGATEDQSGRFQEAKDKRFCVPEGLTSEAMELTVKMRMGEDLAVYPEDRDMPAVSFVTAVISKQFPCQKTK